MRESTKFNGKQGDGQINMPDIDRDYRRHLWSRCSEVSELMDAAMDDKSKTCIICRRNKHSDVHKVM